MLLHVFCTVCAFQVRLRTYVYPASTIRRHSLSHSVSVAMSVFHRSNWSQAHHIRTWLSWVVDCV